MNTIISITNRSNRPVKLTYLVTLQDGSTRMDEQSLLLARNTQEYILGPDRALGIEEVAVAEDIDRGNSLEQKEPTSAAEQANPQYILHGR